MTRAAPHGRTKGATDFAEARVAAERAEAVQQRQAARRVAEHSRNADDCRDLLSMLGLSSLSPGGGPRATRPAHDQSVNLTFPEALGAFRSAEGARR